MDLQQVSETFGNGDRSWAKSRLGFDQCRSITLDLELFDSEYYAANGYIPSGTPLALDEDTGRYGPHSPPTDEQQTVTLTGVPTGGNFVLESDSADADSPTIAFNASVSTFQSRMNTMFGAGNTLVGGSTGAWTVEYIGDLEGTDVAPLALKTNSLTGGTAPSVSISTGQAGDADADPGTLAGHLFNDVEVKPTNTTGRAAGSLFWMGIVDETRLPFPIPPSSKADVPQIRYEEG